jgi:hypothetical protein
MNGDEHEESNDACGERSGSDEHGSRTREEPRGAEDADDKKRETSAREQVRAPPLVFRCRGEVGGARLVPVYDLAVVVRDQVLSSFSDW